MDAFFSDSPAGVPTAPANSGAAVVGAAQATPFALSAAPPWSLSSSQNLAPVAKAAPTTPTGHPPAAAAAAAAAAGSTPTDGTSRSLGAVGAAGAATAGSMVAGSGAVATDSAAPAGFEDEDHEKES